MALLLSFWFWVKTLLKEKRLFFQPSLNFTQSILHYRDFNDANVVNEYILSDFSQNCLERIAKGLNSNSGHRAWRITGDYGTGKSSFALFLAHWFAGQASQFSLSIKKAVDYKYFTDKKPQFIPVLVTGSRTPLGPPILKALYDCLDSLYTRGKKSKVFVEIENYVQSKQRLSDEKITKLVVDTNRQTVLSGKGTGLLIIIDELGKYLEFAALYPDQQDVYLLQRLAEMASRSEQKPFFILGLLHQGFNAYADQLTQSGQREWEKVAARFEELIFNQPIEQTSTLVSSALKVQTNKLPKYHFDIGKKDMMETIRLGWLGPAPAKKVLLENATRLYPIHPTVLPVLVRIFSRFGQNERSLFSFLLSNEPFGLQSFAETYFVKKKCYYRLSDLYDYVRFNFGYRLSAQSYRTQWNNIESMVDSFATNSELELEILKTVGIVNLINQHDLLATEQSIQTALSNSFYSPKEIKGAIETLQKKRHVLYHRGAAGGYCLWPHTSVDLDQALENATKVLGTPKNVSKIVKNFVDPTPIVARRHYIKTGNLRHFEMHYCSASDLPSILNTIRGEAAGAIIIPLCETREERNRAKEFINNSKLNKGLGILIATPPPLNILTGLVQEAQRWEWVARNTPELEADRFAAKEVSRQIDFSRSSLLKQINSFIGLRQFAGQLDLEWYQQGEKILISSGRELLSTLSDICDRVYSRAPQIKNELVNRDSLSSAAAAARMRLIERMLNASEKPFLGMDPNKKPPEMSIYLSVLKQSMVHQHKNGRWGINLPDKKQDVCKLLPVFDLLQKIVKSKPDKKISISNIYAELKKPPYGVRDGLIPILLAAFKVMYEHEVAFYENGSFLRMVAGEEFQRLIKAPEAFEIQYCKIEGVRTDVYNKIIAALELKALNNKEPELLDVVQALCVFAVNLPNYVQNTKKLSQEAVAVRDAILTAREPVKLLFDDLPKACGFEPFKIENVVEDRTVKDFVQTLRKALNELKIAYPELKERLKTQIQDAFNTSGSFVKLKRSISERAERVAISVSEPKLKAFCLRLLDNSLPESEWIESIGSYLSAKPPEKWKDDDEDKFHQELIKKTTKFSRVESLIFSKDSKSKNSTGMRLALTKSDGDEQENVIYISPDEEPMVQEVQKEVAALILKHKNIGLAATFRAIWDNLPKKK